MSEKLGKITFFQKLKETVRNINESVAEINHEMEIPKCDLPEYSALKRLNELQDELHIVKNDAKCVEKDLMEFNNNAICFSNGMQDLVSDMEDRIANIIDHVSKYGYKPEQSIPIVQEHGEHDLGKQLATPAPKLEKTNGKAEALLDRTPLLIDYGLMSKKKSNTKTNIQTSLHTSQEKPLQFQKDKSKIGNQMCSKDFSASVKQQYKQGNKILEETFEQTPKIGDFSTSNRQLNTASPELRSNGRDLNSNRDCTEEICIVKSLVLDDFADKQESTPELPLPFNAVRLSQKEKVHITPEGPPDIVLSKDKVFSTPEAPTQNIKVSVRQVDKTPELNLTPYRTVRDK